MSETLQKLRDIGIEEINHKTHISVHSLNAILEERFSDISYIHYSGFLNLLESDLGIDMSELRQSYLDYKEDIGQVADERALFLTPPGEVKNYKALIISVISMVLVIIFFSTMSSDEKADAELIETLSENSAIEDASKEMPKKGNYLKVQQNKEIKDTKKAQTTSKKNTPKIASFNAEEAIEDETKSKNTHPFVIYPKEALWIGIIDIDTKSQRDTITSAPFVLDENANLLISLGHGMVKIELNSNLTNLSDNGRIRYFYNKGQLKRIDLETFKNLNEGKSW